MNVVFAFKKKYTKVTLKSILCIKHFNGIYLNIVRNHHLLHTYTLQKQIQKIHSSRISKFFFNSILFIYFVLLSPSNRISLLRFTNTQSKMSQEKYNYGLLTQTNKVSSQWQYMDNLSSALITH